MIRYHAALIALCALLMGQDECGPSGPRELPPPQGGIYMYNAQNGDSHPYVNIQIKAAT